MFEPFEQVKEAATPDEMRAELERLSYSDSLTRNIFQTARYSGLSGEDKYVILAYHAMRDRQRFMQDKYMTAMTTVTPNVIIGGKKP